MASGNLLIVYRLLLVAGFRIARIFLKLFQFFAWRLDSTQKKLNEMYADPNNTKIHVVKIFKCLKFDVYESIVREDFMYFHDRFERVVYIRENDYVTLLTVNDKEAIFVETPRGVDVWKTSVSPFIRLAQINNGIFLLFVPLHTFHRLSEQLTVPQNMLFLFNTARCGSTLLTQMCECTKLCMCASEPDALYALAKRYAAGYPVDELNTVTKDVIKWICRPLRHFSPQAYLIKVIVPATNTLFPVLHELFPTAKNIFMYRNFLKTAQSIHRLSQELPWVRLGCILGKYSVVATEMFFGTMELRTKLQNDLALGILVCISTTKVYLKMYSEEKPVVAVRYEDLVGENKEYACRNIIKYCRLPEESVADALRGLEQDSQRNSSISAAMLRRHNDAKLTPAVKTFANELLSRAGMPLLGECPLFPGTITNKPFTNQ